MPQNLHRETLKAALRVISTAETLDQARTQLSRLLGVFDKLRGQGLAPDKALAEATTRVERLAPPSQPRPAPRPADRRPIRRREPAPS
jgi:hypothetical protein